MSEDEFPPRQTDATGEIEDAADPLVKQKSEQLHARAVETLRQARGGYLLIVLDSDEDGIDITSGGPMSLPGMVAMWTSVIELASEQLQSLIGDALGEP